MAFLNLIKKTNISNIIFYVSVTNAVAFPLLDIHSNKDEYSRIIKNDPCMCVLRLSIYTATGLVSGLLFPITVPVLLIHLYQNNGKLYNL